MKNDNANNKISTSQLKLLSDEFLQTYSNKSLQTIKTYQKALNEFFFFYDVDIEFYFNSEDIERYKSYLQNTKKLVDHSIHTYLTALRRFINFLDSKQIINKLKAKGFKYKIKPKNKKQNFLTSKQIKILIDNISRKKIEGLRDIAIINLIATTGLSENDVSTMKVSDFKLHRKKFSVTYLRDNKEFIMVLQDQTGMSINEYLVERDKGTTIKENPLFCSHSNRSSHQPITIRGIKEMLRLRFEELQINDKSKNNFTPISLRNSGVIFQLLKGKKLEYIMHILPLKHKPTAEKYFTFMKNFTS